MLDNKKNQKKTQKKIQKIVFTGGGTSGHVVPNLVLIEHFLKKHIICSYIGSSTGPEFNLVTDFNASNSLKFYSISSGKFRRYFSFQNGWDLLKIGWGVIQSIYYLWKIKPDLVFSKGGFVSFPVVVGAWVNRIPIVIHESDFSPGLANRLSLPFAQAVCTSFKKTQETLSDKKPVFYTGNPLRSELFDISTDKARDYFNISNSKPLLFIMGGGQGSQLINGVVMNSLDLLLKDYNIIHACGPGNQLAVSKKGYLSYDYLNKEFPYAMSAADVVISRSGANTVYEVLALKKPHIFIPLSKRASRGDQIENAQFFASQGYSEVISEESLTIEGLIGTVKGILANKDSIQERLNHLELPDSVALIDDVIMTKI